MFYGMTVSKETPYIGYFTAKTEAVRHKFFVTDAKTKTPLLDIPMWRGWVNHTQPQRRKPTLLLYRGTARNSFDRIAVTDKDITVSIFRSKDSKQTLEELKLGLQEWMKSLDALMPFIEQTDIDLNRWELADLSLVATYSKDIREFDMHRFPCLQNLFGFQNDTFRLLRSEHSSDNISPKELQVAQLFTQDDAILTAEFLAQELDIPQEEADVLFARYQERAQDFDIEKSLRAYPTIKFSKNEAIIKFVTNIDRTLKYVDILRHVLSSDADDVDSVCPRRMERVVPKVAIPQQEISIEGEYNPDDELNALLGLGEEETIEEPSIAPPPPRASRKVTVGKATTRTYNYFNDRLQEFDPNTFDNSIYPSKCEKKKQVVVLTPEDRARVGEKYNYESAPDSEKLPLEDPDGLAICPPYWCMRDEIPLQEDQLVTGDDGELHCPVCDGKVRNTDNLDTLEYTVIVRDKAKYPDYMKYVSTINQRNIPCCYQKPRAKSVVLEQKQDETYILQEDSAALPSLRLAYIPDDLAKKLQVSTNYEDTTKQRRLLSAKKDVFRVGLGRPSKTLPLLLNDSTPILRPNEARENLMQCSFYRTWNRGDIDDAYMQGKFSILEEVEYVTTFLKSEVILVNTRSGEVQCGFWSDRLGANSRTIVLLDDDILALVERKKDKKLYKTFYNADLRKPPFASKTLPHLRALHTQACSTDLPSLADAIKEVQRKGKTSYEVILDPFERIQAVFLPKEGVLPIQPTSQKADAGVPVRNGYANILTAELPTLATAKAFLADTSHNQFKVSRELQNINGMMTELLLTSGFRVPVQPEAATTQEPAEEVLETLRRNPESDLVEGEPNKEDIALAQKTSYAEEIYQFLLYSLSKDIQTDDWEDLRRMIESRGGKLYKALEKWLGDSAYGDATQSPVEFVNKVRKPCGQYTNKDSCNSSSLCGWHRNTCKIRVKPIVEKEDILKRMTTTLRDNDKQRSLVLDDALSPFFSTILYLEMPHELITTVVP
jgi:hypothetical protein